MKKISVILLAAALIIPLFIINANAAEDAPALVYEPFTHTVQVGSTAVSSVTATGGGLQFYWTVSICDKGYDEVFDLSKSSDVNAFQKLDKTGKMKVSENVEKLENGRTKCSLIVDNIIEFNYGLLVRCTVKNSQGSVECDSATILTHLSAPPAPSLTLVADFSVRAKKIVKLSCFPDIPDGAGYGYDDFEYNWYQTPDGKKENGVFLDEHDPVLIADAYAPTPGLYFFFCEVYYKYGITDYLMETGVTIMRVYEPKNIISFENDTVTVSDGEQATLTCNVTVNPEKDKGKLSYQWYVGGTSDSIFKKVEGATKATLTVKGQSTATTEYYTCVVTNEPEDGITFDNDMDEKPFVKVVHTGEKPIKINKMPDNAKAEAGQLVTFEVKAENVSGYQWIMTSADGTEESLVEALDQFEHSGEKSAALVIKATEALDGCKFHCRLEGGGKVLNTDKAVLTVTVPETETEKVTETETDKQTETETDTATESQKVTDTDKKPETSETTTNAGKNDNKTVNTLLVVLVIVICVLCVALVAVGIFVLIKFRRK